jgi:hypothetical protein
MKVRPLNILRLALKLLGRKRNWIQYLEAQNSNGMYVNVNDPSACQFCLSGAIIAAGYRLGADSDEIWQARRRVLRTLGNLNLPPIVAYNDTEGRRWEEVVSVLKRAIRVRS